MLGRTLLYSFLITGILYFGAFSCGSTGSGSGSQVASVELTSSDSDLFPGETTQLNAVARDANGNVVGTAVITFLTDFPDFAGVDGAGLLSALYPGSVTATASAGGVTSNALLLTVLPPENNGNLLQITDNAVDDDWGDNNSWKMVAAGKILWQRSDGVDTEIWLGDVADQAGTPDLVKTVMNMDVDFMALGSGMAGYDIAAWRENMSNTFVSMDGATPTDLGPQDQEEGSIDAGCFFFREGNVDHDIQLHTFAGGLAEIATSPGLEEYRGPVGHDCQAVWEHRIGAVSQLAFWDGAVQTTLVGGLPNFPQYDYRNGYAVWAQGGDIIILDTTDPNGVAVPLTTDGAAALDTHPKTDGVSVIWRRVEGLDEHIMLYNLATGAQERISTNGEAKDGTSLWIDQKQAVWWECVGGAPCLNANTRLVFHDGSGTAAGTATITQLPGIVLDASYKPYLENGFLGFVGNDGMDTEVFAFY